MVFVYARVEFSKVPGFKQWEKKNIMRAGKFIDPDLEFLNDKRCENIHQRNVSMKGTMEFSVNTEPSVEERKELREKNLPVPPQRMSRGPTKTISIFFQDKEDMEVMDYCENVHQKIGSILRDCEKEFKIY